MIMIAPGPHVHGLALAIRFFHPENLLEEPDALVKFGAKDLKMSQLSNIMDRLWTVSHGNLLSPVGEARLTICPDAQLINVQLCSSRTNCFSCEKQCITCLLRTYPDLPLRATTPTMNWGATQGSWQALAESALLDWQPRGRGTGRPDRRRHSVPPRWLLHGMLLAHADVPHQITGRGACQRA